MPWVGLISYTTGVKAWLHKSGHYLQNPPPGCVLCFGVRRFGDGLFPDMPVPVGSLVGLCLLGRPVARMLPQDGSMLELTRMVLAPGLPYATASHVLRVACDYALTTNCAAVISYHDRTRHSGCIYRKAGFKKNGKTTPPKGAGWASRDRSESAAANGATPKQRWIYQ